MLAILFFYGFSYVQPTVLGQWNTVDEETGEVKAVVEIFERNGRVYGKVLKIMNREHPDPVCENCDEQDDRHKKKIMGMEIIKDMKKLGEEYSGGNILDPENGRVYKCRLWIQDEKLMIRGYWGPFYRTQIWRKSS